MADENNLEDIRISQLTAIDSVDKTKDYLVVSHYSSSYSDDYKSFKVNPSDLLKGAGVTYTAGDHIAISASNEISATYTAATTMSDGLMASSDKSKLENIENNANNYTLPTATNLVKGGVIIGDHISVTSDGKISAEVGPTYTAGTNVQISNQNVISATDTTYSNATQNDAGLMSAADKTKLDNLTNTFSGLTDTNIDSNTLANGQMVKYDSSSSKWVNANFPITGLNSLSDVSIDTNNLFDAQGLIYDINLGKWINATISGGGGGGGATALNGLSDVTITSAALANGQVLTYDTSVIPAQWVNAALPTTALGGLSDVTITSGTLATNQVLTYDGSAWVNAAAPAGATALSALTDVNVTGVTDGQYLKYDGTSQKWIPATGGGGGASWVDLTGTLTAGSTSITLSDASITTSSTVKVFTDVYGVNAKNVAVSTGSVTVTFNSLGYNLGVKVRIT